MREYQKDVIDGDTLEKRREQRAEQLEKFLWGLTPEDRKGLAGTVNQWTEGAGVRVVPASQSLYDLSAGKDKRLRNVAATSTFEEPKMIKRTAEQRLDSMVARLKATDPALIEPVLRDIAGEYWKAGAPVSTDQLRAVASHFLNRAERRKG
jgi:hypothetical protein